MSAFRFIIACLGLAASFAPHALSEEVSPLCAALTSNEARIDTIFEVERRWGISPAVQLAMLHETTLFFEAKRQVRIADRVAIHLQGTEPGRGLGVRFAPPATWSQFTTETDRPSASPDRFDDAAHYLGWYVHGVQHYFGIPQADLHRMKLALANGPQAPPNRFNAPDADTNETRLQSYEAAWNSCLQSLNKNCPSSFMRATAPLRRAVPADPKCSDQ